MGRLPPSGSRGEVLRARGAFALAQGDCDAQLLERPATELDLALAEEREDVALELGRGRVRRPHFLKGGMNVSLRLVWANVGVLVVLFAVKLARRWVGVYPLAARWVPADAGSSRRSWRAR